MSDLIALQSLTPDDRDAVLELDQAAFGFDARNLRPDEHAAWVEWDRAFAARRGTALAGIYVVFSYGLTVPGWPPDVTAVVPMAGLSWVAVHPDHRRRGVLTAMIRDHLHRVHEDGRAEPVSGLFASEMGIYGRFGYGVATDSRRYHVPSQAMLRAPRDTGDVTTRFESANPEKHDDIVTQVYLQACQLRPGHTVRPPIQWRRHLQDPVENRPAGAEALKIVVAERSGVPSGYAVVRRTLDWGEQAPEGKTRVLDLQTVDTPSSFALWRRVLDFDLTTEVITPGLPLDHALAVWAEESGASTSQGHRFWTRIVDVDSALSRRGYARELDLVLEITDEVCPWNARRWRLAADGSAAICQPTTDAADVALDVRELGACYLGGVSLAALGEAGLVEERTNGALATASMAFRSPLLPATPYMF